MNRTRNIGIWHLDVKKTALRSVGIKPPQYKTGVRRRRHDRCSKGEAFSKRPLGMCGEKMDRNKQNENTKKNHRKTVQNEYGSVYAVRIEYTVKNAMRNTSNYFY